MSSGQIRVRFAPSPTGYLHVGGARTALFNWLFAGATAVPLSCESRTRTKPRNTEPALQAIYDGAELAGTEWDEGPHAGATTDRIARASVGAIYQRYADKLQASGHVYTDDAGALRFRLPASLIAFDDLVCGHIRGRSEQVAEPRWFSGIGHDHSACAE
jgi:glutamyl-tRNA synthetase